MKAVSVGGLLLILALPLGAQNKTEAPILKDELALIRELQQKKQLTLADAATFVMIYMGKVSNKANPNERYAFLINKHILNKEELLQLQEPLKRAKAAQLLHRAFQLPQGLWYSLTGWGRYAHFDMQYLGIMNDSASEWNTVSGSAFLSMLESAAEKEAEYGGKPAEDSYENFEPQLQNGLKPVEAQKVANTKKEGNHGK